MARAGSGRRLLAGALTVLSAAAAPAFAAFLAGSAPAEAAGGRWTAGDGHTHTCLSDGGKTPEEVAGLAFSNGLDWLVNTDHGGVSRRDRYGNPFPKPVPRWVTLETESWPAVLRLREEHPDKTILLGFEWNVPGHEHANVAILAEEPDALSGFEYMCDADDPDDAGRDLPKWNRTRADAVACAAFLDGRYGRAALLLPNHPSRRARFGIAALRELNDAAPTAMFGFEGIPGGQKSAARGGYDHVSPYRFDNSRWRTHGGADFMAAKVGGGWDALLGEGRRFFLFANSDFHGKGFRPGEYARTHVFVKGSGPQAVVDGMRSGNSFSATGNLIDALSFTASARGGVATMGETMRADRGDRVEISVAFHSPGIDGDGNVPRVDHVDLIAGEIAGKAKPGTRAYGIDVNPAVRVVARIFAGNWTCGNGWCAARIDAGPVDGPMYFRLRGTNLPPSTPGETDAEGNPLPDDRACGKGQVPPGCNTREKALADLWFYSNPIFVEVPAR
jgi:hypothetical protein